MKIFRYIIVVFSLTFSGCIVISPTHPYRPAKISVSPKGISTPSIPQGGIITLADAIQTALENNPELAERHWDYESSRSKYKEALSALFPTLKARGSYTQYLDDQRLVPARAPSEPGVFSDQIYSGEIVLTMPIFTGGQIISNIKAAKLLQKAAAQHLAHTRKELIFNIASVYSSILGQEYIINALELSIKAMEEHRKNVKNLISAGKAARVDLMRTDVRLADLEQKLVQERNVQTIQYRLLVNLMGIKDTNTTFVIQGKLQANPIEPDLDAAIAKAYTLRSDYLAAKAELEAQAKYVDAARADFLPKIFIQGSFGRRIADDPTFQPPETSDSEDVGQIGLVTEIPLFQGGKLLARLQRERTKLNAAQERLRKLEIQIQLEVASTVLNLKSSYHRIKVTEKAIKSAEESLRISEEKYSLGKATITDVLDAQAALLEAQSSYYQALSRYNTFLEQLKFVTGEEQ